jgi:hypothetical protein
MFSLGNCSTEAVLLYANMLSSKIVPDVFAYTALLWTVAATGRPHRPHERHNPTKEQTATQPAEC